MNYDETQERLIPLTYDEDQKSIEQSPSMSCSSSFKQEKQHYIRNNNPCYDDIELASLVDTVNTDTIYNDSCFSDTEGLLKDSLVDHTKLRRITGDIPSVAYLVCLVEFTERLSFFMITGCITNMIQRPLPSGSTTGAVLDLSSDESPGALGLGLSIASLISQLLMFTAYLSPLLAGYLADTKYGKFKSIVIGTIIGAIGHGLLVLASVPPILKIVPLSFILTVISIVTIAISAGFIKPNCLPLLMDQYSADKDTVVKQKNGELVIIDYRATLEKLSLSFYLFINIGCFVALLSSFIERRYGFWVVYAVTMAIYITLPFLLFYLKPRLRNLPPQGKSVYDDIFPMLKQLFSKGWASRIAHKQFWLIPVKTNELSLKDFKITVEVCVIYLYFIQFNLNDGTLNSLQINQSGTMQTNGLPNDFFQYFNPLAILITIPFLDFILYPLLRKLRINFTSIHKIAFGFLLGSIGSLICAILQQRIYNISDCGEYASTCATVAPISAWWSGISFAMQATGECFSCVSAYELAYSKSPNSMRSLIVGVYLLMIAVSAVFGGVLSIWSMDPYLTWVFGVVGIIGVVSAVEFYFHFSEFRKSERINL